MHDMFGREKSEVIVANLSNQFYGKVSSIQTAKAVSEMIGKEERLITNHSQGSSRGSKGNRNLSYNTSTSSQERLLIRPQEVMQLHPGEFVGQTVESSIPFFRTRTVETTFRQHYAVAPFNRFADGNAQREIVKKNFNRVKLEISQVIKQYPNIYG